MKMKDCLLVLCLITSGLISCDGHPDRKRSRIFIVQEVKLDDGRSLFWFKDEQENDREGVSYFQITNDQCGLSVDKAHARCNSPVQINNFFGDTIFILTREPLVLMRSDSWFSLKSIEYSPERYDNNKDPNPAKQFFLDSLCFQK